MHGFDSPSFATLCALAARRDTASRHEVHLLHDAGKVIAVVDTVDGPRTVPGEPMTDAGATARQLRREHGADRAIVADAAVVRSALAAAEQAVSPGLPQPALMLLMQQAFRDCAGVVADPPLASLDSWRGLERRLRDAGDGMFVLAAGQAPRWPVALCGRLEAGLVTEVTDLPAEAVAALPALAVLPGLLADRVAL